MCMRRELSPCSNTKKESLSFFLLFFRLYIFCVMPGERVNEVGECTHPYKRKIEASVEGGWMVVLAEEGDIYQKAERTTV